MKIEDIDLIESTRSVRPVIAAWRRELNPDMDRVNVNGGRWPSATRSARPARRLITTLLHELERSDRRSAS
jgi:acetyl-CoA acetyltransferase